MTRAHDFFGENQRLFSSAGTEPEKFNLYGGLTALSRDVSELKDQLRRIESSLSYLSTQINTMSTRR